MKRFSRSAAILAFVFVLCFSISAQATDWTLVNQNLNVPEAITNMSIVDENNLFFATNYLDTSQSLMGTKNWILYSSDGGATLEPRYFLEVFGNLFASETIVMDVDMNTPMEGRICGMLAEGITKMGPWVGGTVDGANTIDNRPTFPTGIAYAEFPLNVIEFVSVSTGFAIGRTTSGFKSVDSGATWGEMDDLPSKYDNSLQNPVEVWDIAYDGESKVYAVSAYGLFPYTSSGELFRTDDLGATWSQVYDYQAAGFGDAGFGSVEFADPDNGWLTVIGKTPMNLPTTAILYTQDGGANWNEANLPGSEELGEPGDYVITDVTMNNLWRGWAVGYYVSSIRSVMLVTNDGGQSWEFDDYKGDGKLRRIEMLNHRRGWAVGYYQTVVSFNNLTNDAPIADAGPNRSVAVSTEITLDGSGSYDPDGDAIRYFWELTEGSAMLDDTASATPIFTTGDTDGCAVFQLIVTDALDLESEPGEVVIAIGNAQCPAPDVEDDDDDDDETDSSDDDEDDDEGGCCG